MFYEECKQICEGFRRLGVRAEVYASEGRGVVLFNHDGKPTLTIEVCEERLLEPQVMKVKVVTVNGKDGSCIKRQVQEVGDEKV